MVTIADILALPVFDNVRLGAPCDNYLSREVINCGTLDCEPFFHDYDIFIPGEFIFTTLGFAQHHPDLAEEALLALIDRNVAAIAIKPYAIKELPESTKKASKSTGVPVFFYDGRYMERVLASVMALIDQDAANSERDHLIDKMLSPSDERRISNLMFEITNMTGVTVQCLAIKPTVEDTITLRALHGIIRGLLEEYTRRFDEVNSTYTCIYDSTILGFVSFKRPPQSVITATEANLAEMIEHAGAIRCGLSLELPLGEGDLAIRQALAALNTAELDELTTVRWSALRFDAFRSAAVTDRLYSRTAATLLELLAEHDKNHGSELKTTAIAFARSFGDVRATADALFQHPNTIRYRLRKIKEVLGMSDSTDKELAVLLQFTSLATDSEFRESFSLKQGSSDGYII